MICSMRCIFSLVAIGTGLLVTGTILVIAERMGRNNKSVKEMKFRHAVFVGLMQGVCDMPGSFQIGLDSFRRSDIGTQQGIRSEVRISHINPVDTRFSDT